MESETKNTVDLPSETPEPKKQRDYKRPFFISLGFSLLGILFWAYLAYQSSHGVSGVEFIAIALFPILLIAPIATVIYGIAFLVVKFRKPSQT